MIDIFPLVQYKHQTSSLLHNLIAYFHNQVHRKGRYIIQINIYLYTLSVVWLKCVMISAIQNYK